MKLLEITFLLVIGANAKIHHLYLQDDIRRNILLTEFGYASGGRLIFQLTNFTVPDEIVETSSDRKLRKTAHLGLIGFSLSRGDEVRESVRSQPALCQLEQRYNGKNAIFFLFNFTDDRLDLVKTGSLQALPVCSNLKANCGTRQIWTNRVKREVLPDEVMPRPEMMPRPGDFIPLSLSDNHYSAKFSIGFTEETAGKYHIYYHNCFNYVRQGYSDLVAVDFTVSMVERNVDSYLGAGQIPKPSLYMLLAVLFGLTAIVWMYVLKISRNEDVYKVHKLMALLLLIKCLSLFFHSIDYHFISINGQQREVWAVIYYVMHLLKGALLFGTILLIGTGYTFFKNFLTDKDRKLFMVVIPLQVLNNVALVIIEESETGQLYFEFWSRTFILLDLVCCIAVLLPVIWSIKHLQEGAGTDGKAAFNLEKLRLFRHFYMIIIFYIYFTRIIKFLVMYTVPFDYAWLVALVEETGTWAFFLITGWKFRPLRHNPYLRVSLKDDSEYDGDMDISLTKNGLLENVTRLNRAVLVNDPMEKVSLVDGGNDINNSLTTINRLNKDGSGPDIY